MRDPESSTVLRAGQVIPGLRAKRIRIRHCRRWPRVNAGQGVRATRRNPRTGQRHSDDGAAAPADADCCSSSGSSRTQKVRHDHLSRAVSEATPNLARGDLLSSNASKSALMIIRGGSCESETSILVRSVNAFASIIADENG